LEFRVGVGEWRVDFYKVFNAETQRRREAENFEHRGIE
jgi:hypothetical protein